MISSIRYLGHAGFIIEHRGISLLIDPWFHSAFLQSWFPYPDNRYLLSEVKQGHFHYLYVSHAHEDHYDERLLSTLDRSITVIAPKYRSKVMVRRFRGLGFANIVPLDHKQSLELGPGLTATMYLDTSHKEDSGLLIEIDGLRFLDLNDCNTPMSELPGNIDILAAQFSGAMWYPNCYDYPPSIMGEKVAAVRQGLMDTLYRKVRLTGARAYIPSAGPACFLDPALERYNDRAETIFPHWEDVSGDFAEACPEVAVLRLYPGDKVPIEDGRFVVDHMRDARTHENLVEYRERRREEWGEFYASPEKAVTPSEIEAYFSTLQRRNQHLIHDFRKDITLVSGENTWQVRLGSLAEHFVIDGEEPYDPEYKLIISPRVLRAILEGKTGWEEALLSMRVDLHRDPDVFDLKFMSLLRYGNEPAQTLQLMREQSVTETIERDGLRMQRYCPHAGEDLAHAIIRDGIIECPRHHWCWDARTGECVAGGAIRLRVEVLDSNAPALHVAADADPQYTTLRTREMREA
ncbi:MAG: MBL fold metallo-hydrolase [Acetobacteraceae bacterium]|nr:MBL fold metallo-hydrolase [Acetobacteraceae bacterium]